MASARSHHRCRSRGRSPARSEKVGSKDDPPALGTRPVDARDGAAMVPCRHDGPPRTRPRRTFHHDRDNRSDAGGRGGGGPSLKPRRSLSGFLYVGTKQDNFGLVNKFGRYLHVRIGHGESDKVYNAPRTASLYDSVFMANYHSLRRYPRAIRSWVARGAGAIGIPIPEGAEKDPWDRPRPVRTLLYVPPWEGHTEFAAYTSLPEAGPALIAALPRLTARGTRG